MAEGKLGGAARRRLRRRLGFVALGLGLGLVVLTQWWGERRAERNAVPQERGELAAAGLSAPVQVVRDRRGIPHLRAGSEADAWLALGFVHAQDRLGQMLWMRRVAQGRTAERIGPKGLASDRRARTVGLARLAERDLPAQPASVRRVLRSYAAGVNAWLTRIADGRAGASPGLQEDPAAIAPWQPADSLALWKLEAFTRSVAWDESMVLEALVRRLGAVESRPFFPPGVGVAAALPPGAEARLPGLPTGLPAWPVAALRRAAGRAGASIGSTAFVVGGSLTRRGRPILAADSHLPPQVPAALYEAHLRGGRLEVAGATLPGIPVFWTGFTPDAVFAVTHAPVVVWDLVEETLYSEDPSRYRLGSRWRSLEAREERIAVRGSDDEVLTVRESAHGPLVGRLFGSDRPLALRWSGARRGGGLAAFLALTRARSAADVREAVRAQRDFPVAVAFADSAGQGGWQLGGALPRRELPAGLLPVPAENGAYDWRGIVPPAQLAGASLGHSAAWVVVADAPLVAPRSGIEELWRPGLRQARIEALLQRAADAGPISLGDLVAVQSDVQADGALALAHEALALAGGDALRHREERELVKMLEEWDGSAGPGSRGAVAWHVLQDRLLRRLFAPEVGKDLLERYLALPRSDPQGLLAGALDAAAKGGDPRLPWTDPATVGEAVRTSLREAWLALSVELGASRERWAWGRLHQLRFDALWPGAWPGGLLGPMPYGGDRSTVAVAESGGRDFDARVVSAYRLLVDAANLDLALTALAPGQSEHPGDPNATDGLEPWLAGRPRLLSTSDPVIEDSPVATLTLVPAVPAEGGG